MVNVAGEAAMLVAKLHKLGDRLERPKRLDAKGAGDVYRLFDIVAPVEMASRLALLLRNARPAGQRRALLRPVEHNEQTLAALDEATEGVLRLRPGGWRGSALGTVAIAMLLRTASAAAWCTWRR